jgi:hypothetical protein
MQRKFFPFQFSRAKTNNKNCLDKKTTLNFSNYSTNKLCISVTNELFQRFTKSTSLHFKKVQHTSAAYRKG